MKKNKTYEDLLKDRDLLLNELELYRKNFILSIFLNHNTEVSKIFNLYKDSNFVEGTFFNEASFSDYFKTFAHFDEDRKNVFLSLFSKEDRNLFLTEFKSYELKWLENEEAFKDNIFNNSRKYGQDIELLSKEEKLLFTKNLVNYVKKDIETTSFMNKLKELVKADYLGYRILGLSIFTNFFTYFIGADIALVLFTIAITLVIVIMFPFWDAVEAFLWKHKKIDRLTKTLELSNKLIEAPNSNNEN